MVRVILLVLALVALGLLYVVLPVTVLAYRRLLGTFPVRCPETGRAARVRPDARRAALGAAFGEPRIRLLDCTRWPERRSCAQRCAEQLR